MRKLWTIRWFRVLLGVVLTAALLAPVVLPALQMQRQEPENPIRKENIQPVRRLSFGDGDGGTLAAAPLTQETETGGSQSGQEQNPEQPPEEQTGENVPEQLPEQPRSDPEPQPGQESGEQPGERTDGQPDDAGDETQPDALDLGLVLTWYRYGGERYRSLCPSDTTVRQDVRTAQLPDGKLRYELELRGLDAVDSQITNVEISENNGAFAPADERGSIAMQVGPQGEDSYYTLRVQAVCTHVLEDGARQEQETEFCFVLVYSDELDLEAQLLWTLAGGGTASLRCQPGSRAACTVRNDELEENLLRYSFRLGGQSAEDAKLLSIAYSAANGQSGVLDANGGALTLQSGADGKNAYTISMLTEVTSGGRIRQLTFTFLLEWREEQDLRLNLVWMKNSTEAQSIVCEPGDRASAEIRRTELKLGEFSYQLQPDGRDAAQMTITSASLAAEGGTAQTLAVPDGSTVLRIPDGAASIKYTLTVQARYQKSDGSLKNLTFTYVLRYSGDVSLELRYTLLNGTQTAIRCANGQNKTAQTVYSDEVTDGVLAYTLALTGGDAASGVEISDVSCYQSGSGKTKALGSAESGQIELLVNADGSEGENTFTITAKSEAGEQYTFKINVPYKLRGDGTVKIETNLTDGQKVMNGTNITLTVTAWSEKEDGTLIAQMTASDVVVTLDGEEISETNIRRLYIKCLYFRVICDFCRDSVEEPRIRAHGLNHVAEVGADLGWIGVFENVGLGDDLGVGGVADEVNRIGIGSDSDLELSLDVGGEVCRVQVSGRQFACSGCACGCADGAEEYAFEFSVHKISPFRVLFFVLDEFGDFSEFAGDSGDVGVGGDKFRFGGQEEVCLLDVPCGGSEDVLENRDFAEEGDADRLFHIHLAGPAGQEGFLFHADCSEPVDCG